jgi:hypothetical protein
MQKRVEKVPQMEKYGRMTGFWKKEGRNGLHIPA